MQFMLVVDFSYFLPLFFLLSNDLLLSICISISISLGGGGEGMEGGGGLFLTD